MSKIFHYEVEEVNGVLHSAALCPYGIGDDTSAFGLGSYKCSKCRFCRERDSFKRTVECTLTVLDLSLKYHFYDEIEAGRKKEEYRAYNDYWKPRLMDLNSCWEVWKHYDAILFRRGRGGKRTMLVERLGTRVGYGREDWGAPKGERVFILQLGDRLDRP